jgi:hypothetical protein
MTEELKPLDQPQKVNATIVKFATGESLFMYDIETGIVSSANDKLLRVGNEWAVIEQPNTLYIAAKNKQNALFRFTGMANLQSSKSQA